jgi:Uma2 family endonuclease
VYNAPFDLYLYDKNHFALFAPKKANIQDVFVPDIMVVCNKDKRKNDGIYGAPDLIVEITSKSTARQDYYLKYSNYLAFGVTEYWIVNPIKKRITVYDNSLANDLLIYDYTFGDIVKSETFEGLSVNFSQFVWPDA